LPDKGFGDYIFVSEISWHHDRCDVAYKIGFRGQRERRQMIGPGKRLPASAIDVHNHFPKSKKRFLREPQRRAGASQPAAAILSLLKLGI
jgi:hypothetical protein